MKSTCYYCNTFDVSTCMSFEDALDCENYQDYEALIKKEVIVYSDTDKEYLDKGYMNLAESWGNIRSNDPSTKLGAVIVNQSEKVVGIGYNSFPDGVRETSERYNNRELKYRLIVHAEANAIINAGHEARGGTIYCPLMSCNECAKLIIQAEIKRVVFNKGFMNERWTDSIELAKTMYEESGIIVDGI